MLKIVYALYITGVFIQTSDFLEPTERRQLIGSAYFGNSIYGIPTSGMLNAMSIPPDTYGVPMAMPLQQYSSAPMMYSSFGPSRGAVYQSANVAPVQIPPASQYSAPYVQTVHEQVVSNGQPLSRPLTRTTTVPNPSPTLASAPRDFTFHQTPRGASQFSRANFFQRGTGNTGTTPTPTGQIFQRPTPHLPRPTQIFNRPSPTRSNFYATSVPPKPTSTSSSSTTSTTTTTTTTTTIPTKSDPVTPELAIPLQQVFPENTPPVKLQNEESIPIKNRIESAEITTANPVPDNIFIVPNTQNNNQNTNQINNASNRQQNIAANEMSDELSENLV